MHGEAGIGSLNLLLEPMLLTTTMWHCLEERDKEGDREERKEERLKGL